ncbi:ADP-ribosylglycohydrolase family protein [Candidatus Moduliflexota bacterium]
MLKDLPRIPEDPITRSRYRGCLLGGAVGDALGAPVEFMSGDEIHRTFGDGGIRDYAPAFGKTSAITDDTQMTLFTAEGLLRAFVRGRMKGITTLPGVTAHAYLRWLRTQGREAHLDVEVGMDGWLITHRELFDTRAPGNTCLSALESMKSFGSRATNDSKGCGGVMRVAPAGMCRATWLADSADDNVLIEESFALGVDLAAITHGHPTGQLTAGFLASVIALLLRGRPLDEAIAKSQIPLSMRPDHEETLKAVNRAQDLADESPGSPETLTRLGEGWIAEEALAMSIYCALSAEDFESGVVLAVNHGGDSDSTGAITGNILGAAMGVEAIPGRWLRDLELADVISAVADDLAVFPDWDIGEYISSKESDFYWERYPGW